jgi:hypothetical protein
MREDQPRTFKPQETAQRLARMVGVFPDAGRIVIYVLTLDDSIIPR